MQDASGKLPPDLVAACAARQRRLRAALASHGVDALLIGCDKDIQYLTGFVGHDSLLLIAAEPNPHHSAETVIISDPRYDEFLNPWRESDSAEVVMGVRHRLAEAVRTLCDQRTIKSLGIQSEHVTLAAHKRLAATLNGVRLVETTGLLSSLRMRKDALEVATIERALSIQQDALAAAVNQLCIGMTELEFSAVLEFEMKYRGAQGAGFTPIIGAGPNSSIIHHMTGTAPIKPGVLLVDWGATIDGYNGDLTRTFGVGEMPAKIREIYPIVLEAQMAAIQAIAPGKVCAEIDAAARKVITKAGYGESFGHGLGHGLGMDVHESPYFNDLETSVRLETGMIMTVEPGIYLPGIGGVRIEDDVLITDGGCRVLSDFPKDPSSAVIEPAMSGTR